VRAKSFLFFYALQDRYGRDVFRKAISHMLYARRERELEVSDLIAAFDQETHQSTAEFVRLWMKRPGVPEEFRARYEGSAAATAATDKEIKP
jgi:aminopeptidase N